MVRRTPTERVIQMDLFEIGKRSWGVRNAIWKNTSALVCTGLFLYPHIRGLLHYLCRWFNMFYMCADQTCPQYSRIKSALPNVKNERNVGTVVVLDNSTTCFQRYYHSGGTIIVQDGVHCNRWTLGFIEAFFAMHGDVVCIPSTTPSDVFWRVWQMFLFMRKRLILAYMLEF